MIYTSFDTSINLIKTKKVTCQNSVTTLYCGRRIKTFQVLQGKAVVTHPFFTCDTTKMNAVSRICHAVWHGLCR